MWSYGAVYIKVGGSMEVTISIANILYVATAIGVVGAAVKILSEAKKSLTKPLDEADEKFRHYDACLDRDKKHLDKLDDIIEELGDAVNLLVSANMVTLEHLKDGNSTGKIDSQIKKMDEWLVGRKEYKV